MEGSTQGALHEIELHQIEIIEGPVSRTGAVNTITSIYVRDPGKTSWNSPSTHKSYRSVRMLTDF